MIAVLFTATLIISCWIYVQSSIMECTACDAFRKLTIRYVEVPYNALFLISLLIPLLVFTIYDMIKFRKTKSAKNLV
jgi:hypothetical protein